MAVSVIPSAVPGQEISANAEVSIINGVGFDRFFEVLITGRLEVINCVVQGGIKKREKKNS